MGIELLGAIRRQRHGKGEGIIDIDRLSNVRSEKKVIIRHEVFCCRCSTYSNV